MYDKMMKTDKETEKTELNDDEIRDIKRGVFERLAGRLEYAVDHNMEIHNLTDAELEEADNIQEAKKADREDEKRRLTLGIPKGAPKAVKVWSLTKEGREFLERLWDTFGELKEEMEERVTPAHWIGLLPDSPPMRDKTLQMIDKLQFWSFVGRVSDGWIQDFNSLNQFFGWLEHAHPEILERYKEGCKELVK